MAPDPILIREAAEGRISRVEGFALGVRSHDQAMRQRAGREPTLQLNREVPPRAARVVLLDVRQKILI